ncbi:hypothetical protein BH09SUM1_BH09SUM1_33810 [soil metagenome]
MESPVTIVDGPPADLPESSHVSYNPEKTRKLPITEVETSIAPPANEAALAKWTVVASNDTTIDSSQANPTFKGLKKNPNSFLLQKKLGHGGFGEVWEAVQVSLGRTIAVKRLRKEMVGSEDEARWMEQVFRQEACITSRLDHPNIVPVHDLGSDSSGRPLLAMKMVRGSSWDKLIGAEWEKTPAGDFLARHLPILVNVTQAVAFAHAHGFVHRDLKPSQVMVGDFGEVLLMDWGLALVFDESLSPARGAASTAAGGLPTAETASNPAGTPAYMAPEQTDTGAKRIGTWTDVYLLGGILYHMLCGKAPHESLTSQVSFMKAKMGEYMPMADAAPGREIPAELADLVRVSLEPNEKKRMQTAKEFLQVLLDYQSGATKRRESIAITEEIRKQLDKKGKGYRELSDCVAQLNQARALWPGNPNYAPLRQETFLQYGRSALRHRDLVLARVQGERMDSCAEKVELLAAITGAEVGARRHRQQRRFGVVAMVVFLGVAILTTIWADKSRRIAQKERDVVQIEKDRRVAEMHRAEAARAQAEGLIAFLIGDLRDKLEPSGRNDVLESVGRSALNYFEQLDPAERTPEIDLRHAKVLRQVAAIHLVKNEPKEAAALLEKSAALCASAGTSADAAIGAAATDCALADLDLLIHDDTAALDHAKEAEKILMDGVAANPDDVRWPAEIAIALDRQAASAEGAGYNDAAMRLCTDALAQLALSKDPASSLQRRDLAADLYDRNASLLKLSGKFPDALAAATEALKLRKEFAAADPQNRRRLREVGINYAQLGDLQKETGDGSGSEESYRQAYEIQKSLTMQAAGGLFQSLRGWTPNAPAEPAKKTDPEEFKY